MDFSVYWPSLIGGLVLQQLGLRDSINYFATIISILVGYCIAIQLVYVIHYASKIIPWQLYVNSRLFAVC